MNDGEPASGEAEVVIGSREQLLHLLAEAAEIEHTLMCSYLYAAFSLKNAGEAGLSETEAAAVERWRRAIMSVAIEEMGHLLMVANLTVAVGGRPHFARPNFPVAPGYFPSGVVVRLTGFSAETLEHFIFLERPRGIEETDGAPFEQDDYQREQAHRGVMPSTQDYATIGHLYDAIRANLDSLAGRLGPDNLFIGGSARQIGPDVVDLDGVAAITGLVQAHAAIDLIVEQGEGSSADRDESHYRSFVAIRDEFATLVDANSRFAPAWPVAENPVLRRPPENEDKLFIDDPQAAILLDFACASYGLILRILVQCFGRHGDDSVAHQKALMGAAFDLMHLLGSASKRLARLPASAEASGKNAGMSFTMLRGIEPLLGGDVEELIIREQLAELAHAASRISALDADAVAKLRELSAKFGLDGAR